MVEGTRVFGALLGILPSPEFPAKKTLYAIVFLIYFFLV